MASITSLGTGSGLDLEGIVTKLMSVEQLPLTALSKKQSTSQSKLSAFGSIKSSLSSLQTAAIALTKNDTFSNTTVKSSDDTAINASSDSTAAGGSYTFKVGQLAQGQVLRSNTSFANTAVTFNTGSLAISVGGASAITVNITSSNNTLSGIRDAINAADAGVSASIVNDGTTNRLILSSDTTGLTAGAISIAATDAGSGGTNALTTLDQASLVPVQDPLDANFSVNGLAITRSKNAISDVIDGVTFNLTKSGTLAQPLTSQLTVSRNDTASQKAVTDFVSAYNAAVSQVKSLSSYNAATKTSGILNGDGTLRNIHSQLSSLVGSTVSGLTGGISQLSDIGISVQKDGTLAVDATKLGKAISTNNASVKSLFGATATGNQGVAVRFNAALESFVSSTGLISGRTDGLNTTIRSLQNQADALSLKLTKIEARYRAQFTALDTALASMQSTSSYLTQQIASIQNLTSQSNK